MNIRKFDISNDDTNLVMRATAASRNINQQRMFLLCPILLHMFVGVICAVCDNYFFTWVASLSGKNFYSVSCFSWYTTSQAFIPLIVFE